MHHTAGVTRCDVREYADDALPSEREDRYDLIIIPAPQINTLPNETRELRNLHDVPARFLYADHALIRGYLRNCRGQDIDGAASWHVVNHEREITGREYCAE